MHRLARYRSGRVELWITPCVVTMPPPRSTALVVPTNERLCGTQFAHFPKGGPTPAATKIGERDYDRPRAERREPNGTPLSGVAVVKSSAPGELTYLLTYLITYLLTY